MVRSPASPVAWLLAGAWLALGAPPPACAADAAPPSAPAPVAAPADRPASPTRAEEAAWLADEGTAILGFGLLRVAPLAPKVAGTVTITYEESPSDYAAFDAVQLLVLPGDAFAATGRAFASTTLAFARTPRGVHATSVSVLVDRPRLLLVGYGPFTGPDTGRPLSLRRAWRLEVADDGRVARRWVSSEAGELTVKSWTHRPEVRRGEPVKDPVRGAPHWFEVRPELLYDADLLAAPGDPEPAAVLARRREADSLRARADDLEAAGKGDAASEMRREADDLTATLEDDRLPVPAALAERLRRIPFRWK